MLKQSNIDSASMLAEAKFRKFKRNYDMEQNGERVEAVRRQAWQGIDESIKAQLKIDTPKAYRDLEKRYGRKGK